MNNILRYYCDVKREANDLDKRIRKLSYNADRVIEIRDSLKKLECEYFAKYNELLAEQLRIEKLIGTLEPVERQIVRYRYFDGMRWQAVFRKIHYSQKQTFRIHDNIIKKLNRMV